MRSAAIDFALTDIDVLDDFTTSMNSLEFSCVSTNFAFVGATKASANVGAVNEAVVSVADAPRTFRGSGTGPPEIGTPSLIADPMPLN